jgi:imidazolonepropionase-like amidohydrolase
MKKIQYCLICLLWVSSYAHAQETFPINDVRDNREGAYALTNATVVIDYQTTIASGTLLIQRGKVVSAGSGLSIPSGYTIIDLEGKYIYPSFIDPYSTYGIPKLGGISNVAPWSGKEQISSNKSGAYNANQAIKAETVSATLFSVNSDSAAVLRALGFGAVVTHRPDGLARGTSALVALNNDTENKVMLNSNSTANYSFVKGSSSQMYPISTMGYIAVLRQTYLDASWYSAQKPTPFTDLSLDAWNKSQSLPQVFETKGWLEILRADKLGDEFGVQYVIKGGGDEYQRTAEIKATKATLIIPVNYPAAYAIADPFDADQVSLAQMKHWEMAPSNPTALKNAGVTFAFTTAGLKKKTDFLPNIRKAIARGLSEQDALKSLTYIPAQIIKEEGRLGSLTQGKLANFIITSKPIFDEKSIILENWILGDRYQIKALEQLDYSGKYELKVGASSYALEISGEAGANEAKIVVTDTTSVKVVAKFEPNLVQFSYSPVEKGGQERLSGWTSKTGWTGVGNLVDGTEVRWTAVRTGDLDPEEEKEEEPETPDSALGELIYPFMAHGYQQQPVQETILIKNATLWTNEEAGILEKSDLLIINGKISQIGENLSADGAKVIDATGKHLTSGIIDEHAHIGASSINDIATNSSMVRIGDVLDPTDNNIYNALSGGVTAVQILHGSANPIGGQSALIKLRWGASPEEMKIDGADGFIKFALGENVKRSSNPNSIRFPLTRMGVEQVFVDAFSSALAYDQKWTAYNGLSKKAKGLFTVPRRDLAMEATLEIINKERFISCHSYVQSEINMLMKVAERFDFRINTFTHILEGYKVADKMKAHGAGASTFSDWWAYKWEVRYAIPYNAAIMHNEGIVVAINSDDAEMGRRLNQEAAKTIKYGGLSKEDAWKTVTLNPAKLLHLDQQMGSLKVGKDADVVLWSGEPLSIYSKAETTIIDGKVYYDLERDTKVNQEIATERARLIQKMKKEIEKTKGGQNPVGKKRHHFHCDDLSVDLKNN